MMRSWWMVVFSALACLSCSAGDDVKANEGKVLKKVEGLGFSCEIRSDQKPYCWGRNTHGQLGSGNMNNLTEVEAKVPIDLGPDVVPVEIGAGHESVCVLTDHGAVKCWGGNLYGQLGRGDFNTAGGSAGSMGKNLPTVNFGTEKIATHLAVGQDHTCVALRGGGVRCWGHNQVGQLGIDETRDIGERAEDMGDALKFVKVVGNEKVSRLVSNYKVDATCAKLKKTGKWVCWGEAGSFEELQK